LSTLRHDGSEGYIVPVGDRPQRSRPGVVAAGVRVRAWKMRGGKICTHVPLILHNHAACVARVRYSAATHGVLVKLPHPDRNAVILGARLRNVVLDAA